MVDRVGRHERSQGLEAECRGMGQSLVQRGACGCYGRNTMQCDAMQGAVVKWLLVLVVLVTRGRSERGESQKVWG